MIPYVESKNGLSVLVDGEMQEIPKEHQDFQQIRDIVHNPPPDGVQRIKDILTRTITKVKAALAIAPTSGVTFENGMVLYNGEPIHNTLTDRMLRMLDEKLDVTPLANFLAKLMQNPSKRVIEHLYEFLDYGKIPISPDGDFLAYKAIRKDWTDIYTGTIDNSIGKVVEVPRNSVDEDPDRTCSHGLHVCSFNYLPHFAHANGRIVIVKVNPADVVAIPRDYNNTKMRCCRYEVVQEHQGYYTERKDTLASISVWGWDEDEDDDDGYCEGCDQLSSDCTCY